MLRWLLPGRLPVLAEDCVAANHKYCNISERRTGMSSRAFAADGERTRTICQRCRGGCPAPCMLRQLPRQIGTTLMVASW
jgi:hypothetical protein